MEHATDKYADLHLHTYCSDGTYSPQKVVQIAAKKGFSAIAISDHDTVEGMSEAYTAANEAGIEIIPGVELSAYDGDCEVHILGYYIDYLDKTFLDKLFYLRDVRKKRYERMISLLLEKGIDISDEPLSQNHCTVSYGRPHVAHLLLKKGYVKSIGEAFGRYIGKNCPAYVEKERLSVSDAVSLIQNVQGLSILAHPGLLRDDSKIGEYTQMGIMGLEVFHTDHSLNEQIRFKNYADEHNLLITGGSDCHGDAKAEVLIGKIKLPYKYVEKLKDAKRKLPISTEQHHP